MKKEIVTAGFRWAPEIGPSIVISTNRIATFGLVATIIGTIRWQPNAVPAAVALFITAAYWFAASTSFANPAVTIARSLTDSFSGIAPLSAPGFIGAQIIGAILATFFMAWLLRTTQNTRS